MPGRPRVAVVGAGPAGLVVAHLLRREAIPFVVFERQALAVGCDGSSSLVAAAMTNARVNEQLLPGRFLVIVAAAPPLQEHTVYAAHPRGFAGQMRRGPAQTRYYLEIPATDTAADWPGPRVRDELAVRLGIGRPLDVPLGEMGLLDLRVRVIEPMQQGPLFLAGDAAHLITPAGGKGMNLAIQDGIELAHGSSSVSGHDRTTRGCRPTHGPDSR